MDSIISFDMVKLVLAPAAVYVLKLIIDWAVGKISSPRLTKKHQFDKVPAEKRVEILGKIDELVTSDKQKNKSSVSNLTVQIKFLYEQIGIDLPVWHCHQLISFIADNNISSLDIRLRAFLKNTFLGQFTDKGFSLNTKKMRMSYIINGLFLTVSLCVFIYAWWTSVHPFMKRETAFFFISFTCVYAICIITLTIYIFSQIEETWNGSKFSRLFESWLRNELQKHHVLSVLEISSHTQNEQENAVSLAMKEPQD